MSWLKAHKADFLIVAGFMILPLLLFGNVTIGSQTMLPADNLFQWAPWSTEAASLDVQVPHNGLLSDMVLENLAWKRFIVNSLSQGEIPLWNPHIFAGTPFLATGQHSAYYPFSLLFLILPLAKSYGWYTVSQLWLAGVFTYFFGRVLGQRRLSAAVAGLIFQGSGFLLVSSAVFPMILGSAIWLPLLLASVEMIIRRAGSDKGAGNTFPWALLGAVALGCQILAGHIEITYYTLLVAAFFAVWRLTSLAVGLTNNHSEAKGRWSRYRFLLKPAGWLIGTVLIGLMLGSIQFIPFLEVGQANFREGSATLDQIRGWAFPPRRILTLALPDFFGNPADHHYRDVFSGQEIAFELNYYGELNPHGAYTSNWGIKNYVEGGIYLGILPLLLAGLGIWSAWRQRTDQRSEISFFTTLALLSLSFIFGTPLYAILYYGLPGINQLHSPFRWVFPLSLCVAVLGGYGLDYVAAVGEKAGLQARTGKTRRPGPMRLFTLGEDFTAVSLAAGLAFWSGLLILLGLFLSRSLYPAFEDTVNRLFLGLERAPDAFPGAEAFFSHQFEQVLILAMMLILSGIALKLAAAGFRRTGRTLWTWAIPGVILLDLFVAGYGFNAAADPSLLDHQPELIRWLESQPGLWRITTFTPHGDKPLNANTPWLADLHDIRGYDSIILKQYTDYMAAIETQNELQFNRVQPITNWESLNSPLLDLLGVKYIITSEAIELPKLEEVWRGDGLIVYENLAVVPRAYTQPVSATAIVDDALEATKALDPRQHTIIEADDLPENLPFNPPVELVTVDNPLSPAEIFSYGNLEVIAQATTSEPSWLVLNDTYFDGWDVYITPLEPGGVKGEEFKSELVRVNGNFRGVYLEPGLWQVRYRYSPLSFKIGGLASFMAVVIIVYFFGVWAWRRFYNPTGPLSNTRSIAKNSLAPMALNLFNKSIDFAYAAFYLRILGPTDAGKFATAIIIASWFEIISNWGLNTLIIREVSKDKSQASRYLFNTTFLRFGTALIAGIPIYIYLFSIKQAGNPLGPETTAAILLLMIGMIFSGMGQGLSGLFYAYESAEFPAAITTVTTILRVFFGVAVLVAGYSFVGMAAVSILVSFLTLIILAVAAFRQFPLPGPWRIDLALQRRMLITSYPLMLNHLFAVIFFQIDIPMMRQFNGDETVGWYNSAYKWVNAFNVIPSFFTFALFPVISRQVRSSISEGRRTFQMSIKLMLLLAFPLAAATTILAPLMIGILGGREFLPNGAVALQIVIWSIPIGWMNSVTNYVLIALGREKRLTWAFIIGVGFNATANFILLPMFSFVAASIITIFSEIVLLLLFAHYLRPAMSDVNWLRIIKRPLAVTCIMLWAMVLGNLVHWSLALVFGLLAYPLGLWLLKVFGQEERQILSSLLPEHFPGRALALKLVSRS